MQPTQTIALRHALSCLVFVLGGACTSSTTGNTGNADAGTVSTADASVTDAGHVHGGDAGNTAPDAGGSTQDAGSTQTDAGHTAQDAGGSSQDAGSTAQDAGNQTQDAGSVMQDAGIMTQDAGSTAQDAGGSTPDAGGSTQDAGNSTPDAGPHPCVARARDVAGINRTQAGNRVTLSNFPSTHLQNTRRVTVLLPPGDGPFPVLYAHDGQNLFDPSTAFGGQEWELDETAAQLWSEGVPFIVVGVDNNQDRMQEYTPVADPEYGGGNGDAYLRFVLDEVKPYVDFHFPTRCEPQHTAMMGSSLGGLISFHAGRTRSDVVGRIGALSPSFWWNNRWTLAQYNAQAQRNPVVLWMDAGTDENSPRNRQVDSVVRNMRDIRDRALALGHAWGVDLGTLEAERESHNERAWRHRLRAVLRFLLANDTTPPQHAYAWVHRNPVETSSSASAVLQVTWDDGRALTLPASMVTWTSMHPNVASVGTTDGMATGLSPGEATLRAAWGTFDVTTPLRVEASSAAADTWVELVFRVSVPASTPPGDVIHLAGNHASLGTWEPGLLPMQRIHAGSWRRTALVPLNMGTEYKYTRGNWETVERGPAGEELPNRGDDSSIPWLLWDSVARWRDQ